MWGRCVSSCCRTNLDGRRDRLHVMSRWMGQVGETGAGARLRWLVALAAAIGIFAIEFVWPGVGAEPADEFLEGLHERGCHELGARLSDADGNEPARVGRVPRADSLSSRRDADRPGAADGRRRRADGSCSSRHRRNSNNSSRRIRTVPLPRTHYWNWPMCSWIRRSSSWFRRGRFRTSRRLPSSG